MPDAAVLIVGRNEENKSQDGKMAGVEARTEALQDILSDGNDGSHGMNFEIHVVTETVFDVIEAEIS